MNIRCPQCQTVFRVNPERIPPQGVRARCARCGGTFTVQPPSAEAGGSGPAKAPQPSAATGSSANPSAPRPAPDARREPAANSTSEASRPRESGSDGLPPRPASHGGAAADRGTGATPWPGTTETAERKERPVFGSRDPQARAARLARALVSDIVAYHPERREESLARGTMRTEFREEIMKSWEEYVAQVGSDLAKSTPYFRDALNEILARGQKVF